MDNPRSRLAREFLWTLEQTRNYIKELLKLPPKTRITNERVVLFLVIIVLQEEGLIPFTVSDIERNSGIARTTIYSNLDKFFIPNKIVSRDDVYYTSNVKSPAFLIDPESFYERPIPIADGTESYQQNRQIELAVRNVIRTIDRGSVTSDFNDSRKED